MAINANRIRMMKEKANYDVELQCTRYETECKSKGSRHLSKQEIYHIISLPVSLQDDYLRKIGKFEMEEC